MIGGKSILCFLLVCFLTSLPACGKKAPPVPLNVEEPARVGDMAAYAKDGSIYLNWTIPTTNADRSPLENLVGFRVFRRERSLPFSPCIACSETFTLVAEIDVDYPWGAWVEGGKVLWRDERLTADNEYTYYVVGYNTWMVGSVESSPVRRFWGLPPLAPRELRVERLDRALRIIWQPDPRLLNGDKMAEGPFSLRPEDLKDSSSLAKTLRDSEGPLSRFLWKELSPETRRLMEEYQLYDDSILATPQVQERLVEDLNRILQGPSMYDEERFARIQLSARTKKLSAEKPRGEDLVRLNRRLLQEAYPREIEKYRQDLAGFNIYRRGDGERFAFLPLNGRPVEENQFLDAGLENGRKYYYVVHEVRDYLGTLIEGPGTKEIAGIPEKNIPPLAPTGLIASRTPTGVDLRWERNREPDIAGYDVYRQADGEPGFTKMNPQLIPDTHFFDQTADPKKSYRYRLKAVDASPTHNVSEFSEEVEVKPAP